MCEKVFEICGGTADPFSAKVADAYSDRSRASIRNTNTLDNAYTNTLDIHLSKKSEAQGREFMDRKRIGTALS